MAGNMDYKLATADQIIADMGGRIARTRIARNIPQEELAELAGISVRTLRRLESGKGASLDTFIRLLQALDLAGHLAALLPVTPNSPLESLQRPGKGRQRARRRPEQQDGNWSWDEEETP